MRETVSTASQSASLPPKRPPQENIPQTKLERDKLLNAIQSYVKSKGLVPPLSFDELSRHSDNIIRVARIDQKYRDFVAVLTNNETWRDILAGIPYTRRLLLLPKCFRSEDSCPAEVDEFGLVCERCGRCLIDQLQAEAEQLGYVVLVAEGAPVVMSLIKSGQIQAVVGVSCLSVLEEVFPYMEAAAIPGMAIPLLQDGCAGTTADLDWVYDAIYLAADEQTRRVDLDALRAEVETWFTPAALERVLGKAHSETERIARNWLAKSGKRWRPFLAVCTHQALQDDPQGPVPDELRKIAVAIECFHKASLIHDDIEDKDVMRYGERTVHEEYGVPVALNVGDFLLGEGYRLIAESGIGPARKAEMLRVAARAHRTLCLGQGAELCHADSAAPLKPDDVLEIFRQKTAPAFEVALHLGAIYAGVGEDVLNTLSIYSQALGIGYQIGDDLSDFSERLHAAGPRSLRISILLSIAYDQASDDVRKLLETFRQRPEQAGATDAAATELQGIVSDLGMEARVHQMLEAYKDQAIRCLSSLSNSNLKSLLRRVVGRIFNEIEVMGCCDDNKRGDASSRGFGGEPAR